MYFTGIDQHGFKTAKCEYQQQDRSGKRRELKRLAGCIRSRFYVEQTDDNKSGEGEQFGNGQQIIHPGGTLHTDMVDNGKEKGKSQDTNYSLSGFAEAGGKKGKIDHQQVDQRGIIKDPAEQ